MDPRVKPEDDRQWVEPEDDKQWVKSEDDRHWVKSEDDSAEQGAGQVCQPRFS